MIVANTVLLYSIFMNKKILSKDPWPALPIEQYHAIDDGAWGYLIFFEDGEYCFQTTEIPTKDEILALWGGYLARQVTLKDAS